MAVVRVRVDTAAIQSLFEPGGTPFDKMRRAAAAAKNETTWLIHNRTGELQRSVFYRTRVLRYRCGFDLGARARHAIWVNDGTRTPIWPIHGPYLWVPVSPGSRYRKKRSAVTGQKAQHFLEKSARFGLESEGIPVPPGLRF